MLVNPLVDKPKLQKCECGCTEFIPETDVMDTWATSSLTPMINMKYGEENNLANILKPMSLRSNAHDNIRVWNFYTIVKSFYHFNQIPWKDVMILGFVMAGKSEKMSKSKNNGATNPISLIDNYSADVVRYYGGTGNLGLDTIYDQNMFDKCFIKYLYDYEVGLALNTLEKFFWYFCDNYIEIVKHRLYRPEEFGDKERYSGQKTIYIILYKLLQDFSIFFPFITEEIYQKLYHENKSIHLTKIKPLNFDFKEEIKYGNMICNIISNIRGEKSIKIFL